MPFWGGGWSNPYWEPKRPFRFVVPFPVIVPNEDETVSSIAALAASGRFPWNKYEGQTFDYPCIRCKKPSFSADLLRGANVVGGFQPYLKNAPASYEFTPVELELVDTYNFDLEATLTAYLYGGGELDGFNPNAPPSPYVSTPRPIPISNIAYDSPDFEIIELLDITAHHGPSITGPSAGSIETAFAQRSPQGGASSAVEAGHPEHQLYRARKFILKNALIAGASFGEHSQDTNGLSTVSVQIVYDSYDYEWILYRPDPQWTQKRVTKRYQESYIDVNPDSLSKAQLTALEAEWRHQDDEVARVKELMKQQQIFEENRQQGETARTVGALATAIRADSSLTPEQKAEALERLGPLTDFDPAGDMTTRRRRQQLEEAETEWMKDYDLRKDQEEEFKEAVLAWQAGDATWHQQLLAKSDPMEAARVILETEASDREVEEQQSPAPALNAALDEELLEMAGDQATLHEPEVTPVPTEVLPVDAQGEQTGGRQPSEENPREMAVRIEQEARELVAEDTPRDEGDDEGDELGIPSDEEPPVAAPATDPRIGGDDIEDVELDTSESLQSDEINDAMHRLENDRDTAEDRALLQQENRPATEEEIEQALFGAPPITPLPAGPADADDDGLTYDPAPEQIETPVPDDNEMAPPESEEIPSASAEVPGPTPAPDEPAADSSLTETAGGFGPEPVLAKGDTPYTLRGEETEQRDGEVITAAIMGPDSQASDDYLADLDLGEQGSQRRFDHLPLDTTTLSESLATGQEFHLVSGFGTRSRGDHRGFDARAQIGASAIAVGTGMVAFSGPARGYGETVIITLDDGYEVLYAHLSERSVEVGDIIASGQEIGLTGISGLDLSIPGTGPHLHFEVREPGGEMWGAPGSRGEIDPCPFFAQVGLPPCT